MCMKAPWGATEVWIVQVSAHTLQLHPVAGYLRDEPAPLTDSVINIFQGVESTAHAVFSTELSYGILSFDSIHKDPQPTADRVWNQ